MYWKGGTPLPVHQKQIKLYNIVFIGNEFTHNNGLDLIFRFNERISGFNERIFRFIERISRFNERIFLLDYLQIFLSADFKYQSANPHLGDFS
jgi:hypothetical protein